MKISEVASTVNGKIVCSANLAEREIRRACASDLLSDVLTLNKHGILLITGLSNLQTVRVAEVAEIACILLVRNKKASPEMIRIAEENKIAIIESERSMFFASGVLFKGGLEPLY
jgi:hypothetical protein